MLKDQMRAQIRDAMKGGRTLERTILKVALGEIETAESRTGTDLPEADAIKIVRKLVKSNEEFVAATDDEATKTKLLAEIEVLDALLPQSLDVAAITAALADVVDDIKAAKADGPAMGVAMRTLKASGAVVESKDVNAAVRAIRAE